MDYKTLPWIAGNPLRLQIPLQIVTITADGSVTEDYEPQENDTVTVILRSPRSEKIYNPEIAGNIATIEDNGQLLIGEYAVETLVVEAGGTKRRSYYPCVINVMKATPDMLSAWDDFPQYADGVLLDTPSIFFAIGSGGTIDAYTREESDARFVQKVEMENYYTKSQMLVVLLQYASRDYVDDKAAVLQNAIDLIDVDIVAASGTTLTAEVGKYYTLSSVGTLAITLPTIAAGTTKVQTVTFYISAGITPAVTFTSTHTVIYPKDYKIEANGLYEIGAAWNGIGWVIGLLTLEIPT